MKREIVINADDLESRVAILEDEQLAELHVEREARIVGSIYKAKVVSILRGMDAAFADVGLDRNVFLCADDVGFVSRDGVTVSPAPRSASIAQRLKENQEVVVQIVRAPVAGKGARASTRIAFPGRYLVLLLSLGAQIGVSRKIEDRKERERLKKIGEKIKPKEGGLIIRTEAEGHNRKDLEADLKVLTDLRDRVMKKAGQVRAPAMLHQDLTLVYQVIRDVFSEDVERLLIDEKSVYDNAAELVKSIAPDLRRRVKLYRGQLPIFHKYGIEGEIDRLLRRKVWLAAGGYISIDQAEAFTAIDVNTGRYTGSTRLEDTIFRTNMEAAEEVARQLRLRDLGGIIVIDFIDMEIARNREQVMKGFETALKKDRQRTKILHLSPLGLIEMTRKRRGESLMGILTETCPHCAGLGRVRRPLTVALKIEREACRLASEEDVKALAIRASGAVSSILIGERGARAADLEKRLGVPAYIRADHNLAIEEHQMAPTTRPEARNLTRVFSRGEEVVLDLVDPPEPGGEPEVYGWVEGYRVLVEGVSKVAEGTVLVLSEAERSFGRAHVKGAKMPPAGHRRPAAARPERPATAPAAAPVETAPPAEPPPPVSPPSRRRRRGGRRRSKPPAEVAPPEAVAIEPPAAESPLPSSPPSRKRHRGGRRRSKPPVETVASEAPAVERPPARGAQARAAERTATAPPPAVQPRPAPSKPAAAAPPEGKPKRGGLLRRGARRIGRALS